MVGDHSQLSGPVTRGQGEEKRSTLKVLIIPHECASTSNPGTITSRTHTVTKVGQWAISIFATVPREQR
ncbi:hypothetical protein E2C01_069829 [Portunus trituberculatus]|uniref:Uncharacterized protein n=1 Tax=Portunus trituberculatus TaxID=210409 RepID=A0A5B7HVL3_PORTR|nr:hypothetical protein [Portunus trituberculatus]